MIDTRRTPGLSQTLGGAALVDLPTLSRSCGILVVDDDLAVAEQLAGGLDALGYAVDMVHSAAEALATLAARDDIAVVVSDIRMPGQDGLELAQEILSRRAEAAAAEVVLITGHGTLETAAAAVRVRVSDFLTKPFRLADVAGAVDRALARAQARRAEAAARAAVVSGRDAAAPSGEAPEPMRSRDLHAVSHALRTPLNAIAGSADLLGASRSDGVAGEPLHILRDGLARAVEAVALVEELHQLAEPGAPEPPPVEVVPAALVRDGVARAQPAATVVGVELRVGPQEGSHFVGPGARIGRTLDLCIGAMLETARAGSAIEITTEDSHAAGRRWALVTLLLRSGAATEPTILPPGLVLPQTGSPMARTQETLGFAVARRIAESIGGRLTSGNLGEGTIAIRLALPA